MYTSTRTRLVSVRGVVPGYVQCTRLSYSKINYDSVIIEGIDTYVFDKTTLRKQTNLFLRKLRETGKSYLWCTEAWFRTKPGTTPRTLGKKLAVS